jgi:hypothetical protein
MRASRRWLSLVAVLSAVALVGCSAGGTPGGTPGIKPLPTGAKFDYQLGGSYPPPTGVTIVTRDSTSTPADGAYNICYLNAFQTQPDQQNFWLAKHPSLVLRSSHGNPVIDPGWPGEMILDVATAAKRAAIATLQDRTIDLCAHKGFDAVEFDNLDSYSRSRHAFGLSADIAMAKLLVARAHADGLAAGQKNTTELGSRGKTEIGFDFAVAEECYRYDECAGYTKVYGARVLDIEYADDLRGTFAHDCETPLIPPIPPMAILRDVDLVTPKSKDYVYESC